MTEEEWLASADPTRMWRYLRGKVSDRKLRLFLCACCYTLSDEIPLADWRQAVDIGERYADGLATDRERLKARSAISKAYDRHRTSWPSPRERLWWMCEALREAAIVCVDKRQSLTGGSVLPSLDLMVRHARSRRDPDEIPIHGEYSKIADYWHVDLLRDVAGNPFRPVAFDPEWLTSTVTALAAQMYESRDFSAMPILADALQEAGCENSDILDHCRGPGPHVRGCWVVDRVLGKE